MQEMQSYFNKSPHHACGEGGEVKLSESEVNKIEALMKKGRKAVRVGKYGEALIWGQRAKMLEQKIKERTLTHE